MANPRDIILGNQPRASEFPANFWKLVQGQITDEDWQQAGQKAAGSLAGLPGRTCGAQLADIIATILSETQFGANHWQLNFFRRLYYFVLRPVLPQSGRLLLHRLLGERQQHTSLLNWPIESRYVHFQFETLRHLLALKGWDEAVYIPFWPEGKRFAFVLTHDVEGSQGEGFARRVAEVEESFGYRSCFNFVAEDYRVDLNLLAELKQKGFEIGVHGLNHNGRGFFSKTAFFRQAEKINHYLKDWGAVGFRSPLTLRNPEWMQALNIEYDSSFFDTDPFETIPGGTMSIWPFSMGHFIELPYTLVQDHTLMVTLGEKSPRLWLEKVDFIQRYGGMALLNSHPDYLSDLNHLSIYESFLKTMRQREDYWHALPCNVARWWRERQDLTMPADDNKKITMPTGQFNFGLGHVRRTPDGIDLFPLASSKLES